MNDTIKRWSRLESEEYMAQRIASCWLMFASDSVAKGENPAKLSDQSGYLARCEIELFPEGLARCLRSSFDADYIASRAVEIAKNKLAAGYYPNVRQHFSK